MGREGTVGEDRVAGSGWRVAGNDIGNDHTADDANAFCWVDDYIAHVRPHFEVRANDSLLIVMPNKAVKLNRSGLSILRFLKDGGSIEQVLEQIGEKPQRRQELLYFLCDFRSLMTGCLGEGGGRKAVEVVPHAAMAFNTLPVLSEIAVTYRCNLRCRFCYAACGCKQAARVGTKLSMPANTAGVEHGGARATLKSCGNNVSRRQDDRLAGFEGATSTGTQDTLKAGATPALFAGVPGSAGEDTLKRSPAEQQAGAPLECGTIHRPPKAGMAAHDAAMAPTAEVAGHSEEMTTQQVMRVLEVIRQDAKVPSVSFTGGEPTLREDLEDLIAAAQRIGLRTNLITNGTQLAGNGRAARLRAAGLVSAQVSLEGPTEEVHDNLTGVAGSFERTLEGLQALRQAGVHTHTNTTINALNDDHLEDLVRLVADLGIARMSANMVIPAGSATDRTIQVPYSRIGEIVLRVREAARRYGVEFLWYSPTPMCIFNPLAMGLGNKSCAACDGLLSVSPSGEVLPCSSYPQPVGSLLSQPFDEVWNSARASFFRRKKYAPAECDDCEEFGTCAGGCPLYWSAMGTAELTAAGRVAHATA